MAIENITRRLVLAGLGAIAVPVPALALNEAQAARLIGTLVGDINNVINSGKSEGAMFKDFERIFLRYADVPTIAVGVLGADGRAASSAQKKAFTTAFTGYISRKYGRRFREFIGGQIEVKKTRKVKSFFEVETTARLRGQSPFTVVFQVTDRSGKDKFFNMIIEGVNLFLTERAEIGALLDKRGGNLDRLTKDLRSLG